MKEIGAHGFGLAYDVVPVTNGKAVWDNFKLWVQVGQIGKSLGLVWGGDWTSISDKPHFEFTEGLTAKELRAGKRPTWWDKTESPTSPQAPKLLFKGQLVNWDIKIINEVSYAPLRSIFESMGFKVVWNQDKKLIEIK
jgi:hypothetical protein